MSFRRRLEQTKSSHDLDLPFANLYIDEIDDSEDRNWWNLQTLGQGIWIPELRQRIRLDPVHLQFEVSLYMNSEADKQDLYQRAVFESDNETYIPVPIDYNGTTINNAGALGYRFSYQSAYQQAEFLEIGRIRTAALNIYLDTFLLRPVDVAPASQITLNTSGQTEVVR